MTARKPLRVATEADAPAKPSTITEAAASGDQLALLIALRARLAKAVESADCPPRDLAALTRRLQDVSRDIAAHEARVRQEEAESAHTADEQWDAEAL